MILNLMDEYQRAELFLKDAHVRDTEDSSVLVWLVATNLALDDRVDVDRYLNKLIASVPVSQLKSIVDGISDPNAITFSRRELLIPVIGEKLREKFGALALPGDRTGNAMYSDFFENDGFKQDKFALKPQP